MVWIIIAGIILFIFIRFLNDYNKDNYDLRGQTLNIKFKVIVNMINEFAFNGLGEITHLDKREFNLYRKKENQIIYFVYGTGNLTITWKYKYFHKEVVHERTFYDVRNLSLFEQTRNWRGNDYRNDSSNNKTQKRRLESIGTNLQYNQRIKGTGLALTCHAPVN